MAFVSDGKNGLSYRLDAEERIDQDAYNMLRNNEPEHILAPTFKQMDERRELEYDTSGLNRARDYFSGHVFNRQQLVSVLMGVAGAFAEAEEYMLSAEAFANSLDSAFIDDHLSVRLVYVPVVGYTGCAGAQAFLRDTRRNLEADRTSDDLSYLKTIDSALNDVDGFTVMGFKKLLASLTLKTKQGAGPNAKPRQGFALTGTGAAVQGGTEADLVSAHASPAIAGPAQAVGGLGAPGAPLGGMIVPPAGGDAFGGMAIPPAGGAGPGFAPEGGMAIPGMDGKWSQSSSEDSKKGLFGRSKKEKPARSGKADKQSKKVAKAEAKAAKAEAKAAKKAAKAGGAKKESKKGGRLPFGKDKEMIIPLGPPRMGDDSDFAIPGQEGQPVQIAANSPVSSQPELGSGCGDGPIAATGGTGGFVSQQFDFGSSTSTASLTGDQYNDQDFGITEVYGISSAAKKSANQVKVEQESAPAVKEVPHLPITAHLFRLSTGENRLIEKTPFRVGRRKSEVDFHIPEKPKVSRVHAVITFDGSQFIIRDNKSVNHTKVNGVLLDASDSVALKDGDQIEMGDERFEFKLG